MKTLSTFLLVSVSLFTFVCFNLLNAKHSTHVNLINPKLIAGEQKIKAANLKHLNINLDHGNIQIFPTKDKDVRIIYIKKKFDKGSTLDIKRVESTLIIDCHHDKARKGSKCQVDFKIFIPTSTDIELNHGFGNLTVKGIQGPFDINAGMGKYIFKDISENLSLNLGVGKFDIYYTTMPSHPVEIDINGGKTSGTIYLPRQSHVSYDYSGTSFLSKIVNEFSPLKGNKADFNLDLNIGIGKTYVKKLPLKKKPAKL